MRGAKVVYVELGKLMREGRERKNMTLDNAAMMLGFSTVSYLASCERGNCNFPVRKLARALELYAIPVQDAISAATEDYKAGMEKALTK